MVYIPKAFAPKDPELIYQLVERYDFAMLVTPSEKSPNPAITHLPFIYERGEGPKGTLYAHLAADNPHGEILAAGVSIVSTIVFRGPQSYISPGWYPPDAEDHIPTWNYAVVHAFGKAEPVRDPKQIFWQMGRIFAKHDKGPRLAITEELKTELLGEVRMFRFEIERWEASFKLNQNRTRADAEGVIRVLSQSPDTEKNRLGEIMQKVWNDEPRTS